MDDANSLTRPAFRLGVITLGLAMAMATIGCKSEAASVGPSPNHPVATHVKPSAGTAIQTVTAVQAPAYDGTLGPAAQDHHADGYMYVSYPNAKTPGATSPGLDVTYYPASASPTGVELTQVAVYNDDYKTQTIYSLQNGKLSARDESELTKPIAPDPMLPLMVHLRDVMAAQPAEAAKSDTAPDTVSAAAQAVLKTLPQTLTPQTAPAPVRTTGLGASM